MKAAVQSVLDQTNPNWRLLVVDDGYPDPSIPGWFASLNDDRISYSRNEKNLGANGNYRRCLDFVTNEFCVVMGADDLMKPNYVENILGLIKEFPNTAIIHPGVEVIDENNNVYEPRVDQIKNLLKPKAPQALVIKGEKLVTTLMHGNWMCFPAIVWRSEIIKKVGFRAGLNVTQDLALAIDIIKAGGEMVVSDNIIFQYRRHLGSDSSIKALNGERFKEEKQLFDSLAKEFSKLGWSSASRAARLHMTSRLHSLSLLPKALRAHVSAKPLVKHTFL